MISPSLRARLQSGLPSRRKVLCVDLCRVHGGPPDYTSRPGRPAVPSTESGRWQVSVRTRVLLGVVYPPEGAL